LVDRPGECCPAITAVGRPEDLEAIAELELILERTRTAR
jgi:hypothetical protein